MQKKTLKAIQRKSKALVRTKQSWDGMMNILKLLQRAQANEIIAPVATFEAVDIVSLTSGKI